MTQTALMVLVLVLGGLAFTRRQVTNASAVTAPLLNGYVYAVLIAVAAVLAFLWH